MMIGLWIKGELTRLVLWALAIALTLAAIAFLLVFPMVFLTCAAIGAE
jgi:hypothetical protein